MSALFNIVIFPGGLFLLLNSLAYAWVERKLLARLHNRAGPRWFQPAADIVKLLAKEEVVPEGIDARLFAGPPLVALAGTLTAALYVPLAGRASAASFPGDLIVVVYLLSLLTLSLGLAGATTRDRFALTGATRALTQFLSYEAPFLLALLGPAFAAGSWQINQIIAASAGRWLLLTQPIGFVVALIGLMGKLELPPFDAPEAETEIVAGALTEYSGRFLALFRLSKSIALVVGLTLIGGLYLGGLAGPLDYVVKTLSLLIGMVGLQALLTRLRIDQVAGLWWRVGALLVLLQWLILLVWHGGVP